MATPKLTFRPDLEGLRGIAVVLVVAYHAGTALTGGFVGVDVFCVLPGFLITSLLLAELDRFGRIDLAKFFARRGNDAVPATRPARHRRTAAEANVMASDRPVVLP